MDILNIGSRGELMARRLHFTAAMRILPEQGNCETGFDSRGGSKSGVNDPASMESAMSQKQNVPMLSEDSHQSFPKRSFMGYLPTTSKNLARAWRPKSFIHSGPTGSSYTKSAPQTANSWKEES